MTSCMWKTMLDKQKDLRKRINNHKLDIRGTPTIESLAIDKLTGCFVKPLFIFSILSAHLTHFFSSK